MSLRAHTSRPRAALILCPTLGLVGAGAAGILRAIDARGWSARITLLGLGVAAVGIVGAASAIFILALVRPRPRLTIDGLGIHRHGLRRTSFLPWKEIASLEMIDSGTLRIRMCDVDGGERTERPIHLPVAGLDVPRQL